MSYTDVKNFRHRLKERSVYVMGEKCQCCGYNKCITALEFHHLNPKEKDFSFGSNTNRSWYDTQKELQKCILVCANCHREIHQGLINKDQLKPSFIKERAEEISKLIDDLKSNKIYYCKDCGIEVWRGNNYCPKCAAKKLRIVERPNREILKEKIRNQTFLSIGKEYGVSDNAIRKWCKAYNLPAKKNDIKTYSDTEWEQL